MRIGIDIRLIGKKRTGDEQVFFNLVKNLAKIDHTNEYHLLIDRDPEKDPELTDEIDRLGLDQNFHVIHINAPNRFWWNLWALPRYLQKNSVDVFHTQYIAPFWMPQKTKLVLTIHDISFNFFPQFIKKSDLFFLKTLIPRSLQMATKIISVSEFTKNELEDYYEILPEKISVASNGVDFEIYDREKNKEELKKIQKKYDLPEKFVLYVGTLQPRKNIPVLIEAVKNIDTSLVVVGSKNARNFDPQIEKMIKKYGLREKIIFPGWIDEEDKPTLFKLAICFVFPSLYEGFGIPILEAMAAGTPVVCSDIPVFRKIGEDAALFCNPKKNDEFLKNISKVLNDENLRNNLIEKGKFVAQKFTWHETAKKTLITYESLK